MAVPQREGERKERESVRREKWRDSERSSSIDSVPIPGLLRHQELGDSSGVSTSAVTQAPRPIYLSYLAEQEIYIMEVIIF